MKRQAQFHTEGAPFQTGTLAALQGSWRRFAWQSADDAAHLDPRTAAVLALGEMALAKAKANKMECELKMARPSSLSDWHDFPVYLDLRDDEIIAALAADVEAR